MYTFKMGVPYKASRIYCTALVILLKEPRELWPLHLLAFKIMQIVREELKMLKMFSNCRPHKTK